MKKIVLLLLVAVSSVGFAQETISEGVMLSKQTMSSDNEQMQSQLAMIGDILTTTYFKGNKTRSETSNMMTGTSIAVMDADADQMLVSLNNPMQGKKYMIKSIKPSEEDLKDVKITKGDETKTVLGYECQEYNVEVSKDGATVKLDLYVTEQVSALSSQFANLGIDVKGYALYATMSMSQMGMNLTITQEVTEIKKDVVSDDKFDMTPPEGYEKTDKLQGM